MDTSFILTTALGTGFGTAILNQGIAWWRESRKDGAAIGREAGYLAIKLAVLLEDFSIDCANLIADQELHSSSDGYAGKPHGILPQLATYPDGEWRTLKPDLVGRCLTLRNELKLAEGQIEFWGSVGERDCIPTECKQQAGKCGYRAWVLAHDMRSHYGLGTFDPKYTSWDVVQTLKSEHDKVLLRLREERDAQALKAIREQKSRS